MIKYAKYLVHVIAEINLQMYLRHLQCFELPYSLGFRTRKYTHSYIFKKPEKIKIFGNISTEKYLQRKIDRSSIC